MAEVDPYAQFLGKQPDAAPAASVEDPYVQFLEKKPTVTQDLAKAAGPSLLRGAIGAMTIPGTLFDAVAKGGAWAAHKIAPEATKDFDMGKTLEQAHKIYPKIPSYSAALKGVEHITGPMYNAETGPGKAFQGTMEIAPQLALGGEGLIPTAIRSAAAGTGGELAREGGEWLKPHLPVSIQPAVEPVSRAIGTILGGALARKGTTPNPMTDEQLATVNSLKNFPMSAGQKTQSPTVRGWEARTGLANSIPPAQEKAFTEGVMQRMGGSGGYTSANLANAGQTVGDELGNLRRANQVNPQEYAKLVSDARAAEQNFATNYGAGNTADVNAASALIRHTNPSLNMPGAKYGMVRGQLQDMIEKASTPEAAHEIAGLRQKLDQAFYNSVPPDVANRAKELQNQYVNYNTMRNVPPRIQREAITPQEVLNAVSAKSGRGAANQEQGTLAPYAQQAGRVMSEIKKPEPEKASALSNLLGMAIGGAAGGKVFGGNEALVGGIAGREAVGPILDLLKSGAARATVGTSLGQKYLGNQLWRPGANTPSTQSDLVRLLMAPQNTGLLH